MPLLGQTNKKRILQKVNVLSRALVTLKTKNAGTNDRNEKEELFLI